MNKAQVKGVFIVKNDRGLHTRPSTEIVRLASSYKADVRLVYQKTEVNAKSILGILGLAAARGAKIKITAEGDDADKVVSELIALAQNQFNINY